MSLGERLAKQREANLAKKAHQKAKFDREWDARAEGFAGSDTEADDDENAGGTGDTDVSGVATGGTGG